MIARKIGRAAALKAILKTTADVQEQNKCSLGDAVDFIHSQVLKFAQSPEKHFLTRDNKSILRLVSRSSSAPPSVLSCRSLKRALTCREKCDANTNSFWLHSVIRKGRLSRDVNFDLTTQLCPKNGLFSTLIFSR